MPDITIQVSEETATELAAALGVPAPEVIPTPQSIRANVTVSGGALTLGKNEGFSSITRQSTGLIVFTLSEPMDDTNYIILPAGTCGSAAPQFRVIINSATVFSVTCFLNGTLTDPLALQVKVEA